MKRLIIILFLMLLIIPISLVRASSEESVNLGDFPAKLAEALNVSLFVGQLLASLIFMSLFLFPSMLIAGYFGGAGAVLYAIIFVGLGSSGVCVALGWLPYWMMIVATLAVVGLWSGKIAGVFGGKSD